MSLESTYFKKDYRYKTKFINECIAKIRFSDEEKRIRAYKNLVFKMMKGVVLKNISNYLNLLKPIYRKEVLPERDELISDCYIIFEKCLEKYIINDKYNFYFYFNKSLSRNFFRYYQKEMQRNNNVEITEALTVTNNKLHNNENLESVDLLMSNLGLSELEIRICRSRLLGQKTSEFLEENTDISSGMYSKCLKEIKNILIDFQNKEEI